MRVTATTTIVILFIVAIAILAPLNKGNDLIEMGGWLVLIPFCFLMLGYSSKSVRIGILVGLSTYFFLIMGYWNSAVKYGIWSSLSDDGAVFYPLGYMILSSVSALYSSRKRVKGRSLDDTYIYDDDTRIY
jgi:hypothetical protein